MKIVLYFLGIVILSGVVSWLGCYTQVFHPIVGIGLFCGLVAGFVIAENADKNLMLAFLLASIIIGFFLGYVAGLELNSWTAVDDYSFWSTCFLVVAAGLGMFLTSSVVKISIDK